jgi:hypothetical protein
MSNPNPNDEFSLEDLENSGSDILSRVSEEIKGSSDITAHSSHSSHASSTHTSSS